MPQIFEYNCPMCGYSTSCGNETGFELWYSGNMTQKCVCDACGEESDILIGKYGNITIKNFENVKCPKCNAKGKLRPWHFIDSCPICNHKLEKSEHPIMMVD